MHTRITLFGILESPAELKVYIFWGLRNSAAKIYIYIYITNYILRDLQLLAPFLSYLQDLVLRVSYVAAEAQEATTLPEARGWGFGLGFRV